MAKRFVWIATFVLLGGPALAQTAKYRDNGDKIQSDDGRTYVNGVDCSLVQTNSEGNFFMRTSWFNGEGCEGCDCGELDIGQGRYMKLIFEGDCSKFIDHPDLACGENLFQDVMFSAGSMFARPKGKKGIVPTEVRLTFSKTQLARESGKWYELIFLEKIPVEPFDDCARRITAGEGALATLILKLDQNAPKTKGKKPKPDVLGTFTMPFQLTVYPEGCTPPPQ